MPKNRKYSSNSRRPQSPKARRDSQGRSTTRSHRGRERHLSVRGELRDKPDVQKIARAVIAMAMAQAEAEAQAAAEANREHTEPADDNPQREATNG